MINQTRRPTTANDRWTSETADARLDDQLLYAHVRGSIVALSSGAAALALPALGLVVTACLLTVLSAPVRPLVWLLWSTSFLIYCGLSGACAGLLAMWAHRTGHWREVAGGLLLWPASFPPSYAFVLTLMATASRQPNPILSQPIPDSWSDATLRAILVSACLATLWFATWRPLNAILLRKVGKVDQSDVTAGLLRDYYHRRWFSQTHGNVDSKYDARANASAAVKRRIRPHG